MKLTYGLRFRRIVFVRFFSFKAFPVLPALSSIPEGEDLSLRRGSQATVSQ